MKSTRITCAVALALAIAVLVATNAPEAFGLLVLVACVPIASVALGRLQTRSTRVTFALNDSCTTNETLVLRIGLEQPRLLRGRVDLLFEAENLLCGTAVELPVSLAPSAGPTEDFELALRTDCPGQVRFRLVSASVGDVLGFCDFAVPGAALNTVCTIYPPIGEIELHMHLSSGQASESAQFDLSRPGSDRSEVFETRAFAQGDSLKDVHWKLSARTRELQIRVPSDPSDHSIALVCGAHAIDIDDHAQARVLAAQFGLLSSVSLGLLRAGEPHIVVRPVGRSLEAIVVETLDDFYSMLDTLLCSPLQDEVVADSALFADLVREHHVTKTVVVTDRVNDEMFAKLGQNTQMSVLHVTSEHATGADGGTTGTLLRVFAADVPDRIKALEL